VSTSSATTARGCRRSGAGDAARPATLAVLAPHVGGLAEAVRRPDRRRVQLHAHPFDALVRIRPWSADRRRRSSRRCPRLVLDHVDGGRPPFPSNPEPARMPWRAPRPSASRARRRQVAGRGPPGPELVDAPVRWRRPRRATVGAELVKTKSPRSRRVRVREQGPEEKPFEAVTVTMPVVRTVWPVRGCGRALTSWIAIAAIGVVTVRTSVPLRSGLASVTDSGGSRARGRGPTDRRLERRTSVGAVTSPWSRRRRRTGCASRRSASVTRDGSPVLAGCPV